MRRGRTGSGRLRAASNRPSRLEPAFQLLEGRLQRAEAVRLERIADELILALDVVQAQPAAHDDAHAVLGPESQHPRGHAEHHGANLRAVVLQREVDVAGAPLPAVRDLALDEHAAERLLDDLLDGGRQLADRQRRGPIVVEREAGRMAPCSAGRRVLAGELLDVLLRQPEALDARPRGPSFHRPR